MPQPLCLLNVSLMRYPTRNPEAFNNHKILQKIKAILPLLEQNLLYFIHYISAFPCLKKWVALWSRRNMPGFDLWVNEHVQCKNLWLISASMKYISGSVFFNSSLELDSDNWAYVEIPFVPSKIHLKIGKWWWQSYPKLGKVDNCRWVTSTLDY